MNAFTVMLSGLVIVFFLFWIIKVIFARERSMKDFFKGETGYYSISQLQASLWAYVIISYQVSAIVAVYYAGHIDSADNFRLVFSEEVLWLLGLSLGSYVTVKGITLSKNSPEEIKTKKSKAKPKLSDFVVSNNQLDLSRFQMLIWTFIALITFMASCYNYYNKILKASYAGTEILDSTDSIPLFPPFSDSDGKIPTVDMSFIVLMGLSNGVYIGRKLVPDFKKEEVTREYTADLKYRTEAIDIGLRFKEAEYEIMKVSPTVPDSKKMEAEQALAKLRIEKENLVAEMNDVNKT